MIVEEEEILTSYGDPEGHPADTQYKIMRGNYTTPEKLAEMLQEQSYYGWVLLEVFDGHRIRLKRPASEAEKDRERQGNPYETHKAVKLGGCAVNAIVFIVGIGSALVTGAAILTASIA